MAMETLSTKIRNYQYAPGIATYGVDGNTGLEGQKGTSIFFTNYNFTTEHNDLLQLIEKIRSSKSLIKNNNTTLDREYIEGDYILNNLADLYKIIDFENYASNYLLVSNDKNSIAYNLFFKYIGNLKFKNSDDAAFGISDNNRVYSKGNSLVLSTDSSDNLEDNDFIFNIINNNENNNNEINFISLITKYQENNNDELQFYFDTKENSFHIKSASPIILDSSYIQVLSSNDDNDLLDNYSPVSTKTSSINTVTGLYNICSKIKYNCINSTIQFIFDDDVATQIFSSLNSFYIKLMYNDNNTLKTVIYDNPNLDDLLTNKFFTLENVPTNIISNLKFVSLISQIEIFIDKQI